MTYNKKFIGESFNFKYRQVVKMKLWDFLQNYNDYDFDSCDTEIDVIVTICWCKDNDFNEPYDLFQKVLLQKVELKEARGDKYICPVMADYSKLVLDNIEVIKEFILKNWREDFREITEDTTEEYVDLRYYFINELHNLLSGAGNDRDYKNYIKLFEKFN